MKMHPIMKHIESTSEQPCRILIADDEPLVCELMQFNLEKEGFEVDVFRNVDEAYQADLPNYNLFIIDVMMNDMMGMNFAHHLKQTKSTTSIPLIFCTACDGESDIINGLNSGADDYILKPFSMKEMIARVNAVLRRHRMSTPTPPAKVLTCRDMRINIDEMTVYIGDKLIDLTNNEFYLLTLFVNNRNRLFSHNEIIDTIWPGEMPVSRRTIDINIARLRKKLGDYAEQLVDRPGFGYGYVE